MAWSCLVNLRNWPTRGMSYRQSDGKGVLKHGVLVLQVVFKTALHELATRFERLKKIYDKKLEKNYFLMLSNTIIFTKIHNKGKVTCFALVFFQWIFLFAFTFLFVWVGNFENVLRMSMYYMKIRFFSPKSISSNIDSPNEYFAKLEQKIDRND